MQVDLSDYVKEYELFDRSSATSLILELNEINAWERHTFSNTYGEREAVSGENEPDTCQVLVKKHQDMIDKLWFVIHDYINDIDSPVFQGWLGFSAPKYIKYNEGQTMAPHCDHIHTLFDGEHKGVPVLTIICALNDNYEGGELTIAGEQYNLKAGNVVVFPSNFMFPHEVSKVTSGNRYSFAVWAW